MAAKAAGTHEPDWEAAPNTNGLALGLRVGPVLPVKDDVAACPPAEGCGCDGARECAKAGSYPETDICPDALRE